MKKANAFGLVLKNGSIVVDVCSKIGLCKKVEEDEFILFFDLAEY